jgi:hypothetical protein
VKAKGTAGVFHALVICDAVWRQGTEVARIGFPRRQGHDGKMKHSSPILAMFGAALLAAGSGPAASATYGLAVGINDYVGRSNDLAGAVNDAEDIAAALRAAGAAEVVLLLDDDASRAAIEAAWLRLVATASPGDTLVFSYAGHGSQEPEPPGRRGEADGLNETFILGGYQSIGPAVSERIIDDEIFAWLRLAEERGLEVIFVADSCYSGTMYRAIAGPALRTRNGDFDPPEGTDQLAQVDLAFATIAERDFARVTFVGSSQEDKVTPELMIDGMPRGALSWAFARAIEGAADHDGDGAITQQELLAYLVPAVEIHAQNQQTPSILPITPETRALIRIGEGTERIASPAAPPQVLVRVAIRGGGTLPSIVGVGLAETEIDADLIWDAGAGWVEHRIGGRVAEDVTPDDIGPILAKWAALAVIESLALREPFAMGLLTGNAVHVRGERLTVVMSGGTRRYLTLFNLAPNGRVELLAPINPAEAEEDWRGEQRTLRLEVADPPFGAEHLVAILTDERPSALQAALRNMETPSDAAGLAALLTELLAGGNVQAGILGIYTAAD